MILLDIIERLGTNYKNDQIVLEDIINDITSIACDISNRQATDEKLKPYVKKSVISAYLLRGDEGKTSSNEGGISYTYEDIIEKLRNDIIKNGIRRMK